MKKFLRYLMASSTFSEAEIQNLSMPAVRELVFRVAAHTTPLSIIPAVIYNWSIGLRVLAGYEVILTAILLFNTGLLIVKNVRLFSPLALLLISYAILLSTVLSGVPQFIYFAFAFPVALYLLVNRRQSLILNIVWWVIICGVAWRLLPRIEAISFMFSLASVCFFLEVLSAILARNEEQLKMLVVRDPLTNAFNRRAMKEAMEYAVMMHERYGVISSIIMMDIDKFKNVNDTYGHKEGDVVLKKLVTFTLNRLRSTDKLCRYGGEEFVIILPNTDARQAFILAQAIREQISSTTISTKTQVTVSCGVAESRSDDDVKGWLHRSDLALYSAKNNGRNCVELEDLEAVA